VNYFIEVVDRWSNKILEILQRFPLASLSSFLVTILSIIFIEANISSPTDFILISNKIALVATLGIFLFPALHLLSKKIWFKLVGIGLLVLYFYFLPLNVLDSVVMVRHGLLLLALLFMLFWAPFMDINISNKNIWEWTQNILLILLVTVILSITSYLIFFVTMHSIESLFGFALDTHHYLQFAILIVGLFSVNYFLGHLPKYIMLLQINKYEEIGLVFTKFVLTPVFFIYFLLMFTYIIKIIFTKTWLVVNVDMMAVGYATVAIATYMYWTPLWDEANKLFRKFIWGSTLLLSIVLGFSIWLRLNNNNIEEYYLLGLFTSWLAIISLYFIFFKKASYKWLFFSISLLIVISQSEPLINLSVNLFDEVSKIS